MIEYRIQVLRDNKWHRLPLPEVTDAEIDQYVGDLTPLETKEALGNLLKSLREGSEVKS